MRLHNLTTKMYCHPRELTLADCEGAECCYHLCLLELAVWYKAYCSCHLPDNVPMRFVDVEEVCRLLWGDVHTFGLLSPARSSVHNFLNMYEDRALRSDWMEAHSLWPGDVYCPLIERAVRIVADYVRLLQHREQLVFHLYAGGLDGGVAIKALFATPCAYPQLVQQLYQFRSLLSHLYPVTELEQLYAHFQHCQQSSHTALCAWWDERQMSQWTIFVRLCIENRLLTEATEEERRSNASVMYSISTDMQRNFCLLLLDYRSSLKYSLKSEGLSLSNNKNEIEDNQLLQLISSTIIPAISPSVFTRAKAGYLRNHQRAHLSVSASGQSLSATPDADSAADSRPLSYILFSVPVPLCGTWQPPLAA